MEIITDVTRGTAEEVRNRQSDGWSYTAVKNTVLTCGFIKPDKPVRNPLVAGYRKPSSYYCPAFVKESDGRVRPNRLGAKWKIEGLAPARPDRPTSISYANTGTACGTLTYTNPVPNINNLRMKLLNNIRSEVLDVAMVLAEVQSTADTLGNGLMRIARTMDMVKRRKPDSFYFLMNGRRRDNRRPTDKFLRETSGAFLEWKYGIMPTVYDIQGACKALDMSADGSLFDNPPLLVARARDILQGVASSKITAVWAAGGDSNTPVEIDYYTERKARCDYRVRSEGLRGLNRYGLGLGTIATVAFDKTPFSFVLNMAIPIADLIKAWTALAGVDVVGYCETTYEKAQVRDGVQVGTARNYPVTYTFKDSPVRIGFKREAFGSPPMPLPYVRNPIKVGNAATVLALFTQLRKST